MLDVYSWILSPEIRDHVRANYPLSVEEKMQIICGAFRSIEEKGTFLRCLLDETEPGEAQICLKKLIRLYGLVAEELRKTGPEHLYVLPISRPCPGKKNSLNVCDAYLYGSYAEVLENAEDICIGPHLGVSKWERVNGKWEAVIEFDVQCVGGVSRTTRFWLDDEKRKEWGIDEETIDLQLGNDELDFERIHYPIPFRTGDLVKLDAPLLDKPLFGVMDNVLDLNGTRYMWLGYVSGDHLDALMLSYNLLDYTGGYRVIDWLHSAKPEELPKGEEILREISEYLSSQPWRDRVGSDVDSEFLDIFGGQDKRVFRRWTQIPFSELLAQVQEERKAHG